MAESTWSSFVFQEHCSKTTSALHMHTAVTFKVLCFITTIQLMDPPFLPKPRRCRNKHKFQDDQSLHQNKLQHRPEKTGFKRKKRQRKFQIKTKTIVLFSLKTKIPDCTRQQWICQKQNCESEAIIAHMFRRIGKVRTNFPLNSQASVCVLIQSRKLPFFQIAVLGVPYIYPCIRV